MQNSKLQFIIQKFCKTIRYTLYAIRLQKGFTLIELLVVIVIIGILISLIMANFVGIRQRARDGQRKADLREIQGALEMYRADNNSYPLSTQANQFTKCGTGTYFSSGTDNAVIYLRPIPCDPLDNGTAYHYNSPDGKAYTLMACLENDKDAQIDSPSAGCPQNRYSITYQSP